jgi:hypothetical protein
MIKLIGRWTSSYAKFGRQVAAFQSTHRMLNHFRSKSMNCSTNFQEKSFMQMTVLECLMVSTVRVTGHVMKYPPLLHFSKEILRATDGVSGLIILSVDLCATKLFELQCKKRADKWSVKLKGFFSWLSLINYPL